jgi:hypothetical protein
MEVRHDPDPWHQRHLEEAVRVLSLPVAATRMHWHPFGVYAIPLAKRSDGERTWSRRLHIWHPEAPSPPPSPYGVHTHSGMARSNVLLGSLHHHLYAFAPDANGPWRVANPGMEGRARLVAHAWAATQAGTAHTLPADHPHGVTKPPGLAVSLFEQVDNGGGQPFTTWQRQDVSAQELQKRGPVPVASAQQLALLALQERLVTATDFVA